MNNICDLKLAVIGGDRRQLVMARELAAAGAEVAVFALEGCEGEDGDSIGEATRAITLTAALTGADAVILPLPVSSDGQHLHTPHRAEKLLLADLFAIIPQKAIILGGRIGGAAAVLADERGLSPIDYSDREDFAMAGATPTAEGAIELAMHHLPITLHGARCAVIGCGRIGFLLACKLRALGAHVIVAARKPGDLIRIDAISCIPHHTGELASLPPVDVIFNTAPAPLFDAPTLAVIAKNAPPLCIELASLPGGFDREAAAALGIPVIDGGGLPGRVAPVTAGKIAARCVMNILKEKGVIS